MGLKIDGNKATVSLNYFGAECKRWTDEAIEAGCMVAFIADCIGHTRAEMFESAGERYLYEKYGRANVEAVKDGFIVWFKVK
jgi:hypothetical protein